MEATRTKLPHSQAAALRRNRERRALESGNGAENAEDWRKHDPPRHSKQSVKWSEQRG